MTKLATKISQLDVRVLNFGLFVIVGIFVRQACSLPLVTLITIPFFTRLASLQADRGILKSLHITKFVNGFEYSDKV